MEYRRRAAGIALLVYLIVAGFLYLLVGPAEIMEEQIRQREREAQATAVANLVANKLDERRYDLTILSRLWEIAPADQRESDVLDAARAMVQNEPVYRSISYIDEAGYVRARADSYQIVYPDGTSSVLAGEHGGLYQRARSLRSAACGLVTSTGEEPILHVIVPLFSDDQFAGWLQAEVSARAVLRTIQVAGVLGPGAGVAATVAGAMVSYWPDRPANASWPLYEGLVTMELEIMGVPWTFEVYLPNTPPKLQHGAAVAAMLLAVTLGLLAFVLQVDNFRLRAARNEVQASEERYRLLAENSEDIIFKLRLLPEPEFEYISPSVEKISGYKLEDVRRNLVPLIDAASEEDKARLEAVLSDPEKFAGEPFLLRWVAKDGRTIWTEQNLTPVYDDSGRCAAAIGVARDVTSRKMAEDELAAEHRLLEVTLQSIGDCVISTDLGGRVVHINRAAEELTGYSAAEAIGRPLEEVFQIVNEVTGEPASDPVAQVLQSGRMVGLANHTALIARDGRWHSIADSAAPIKDHDGRLLGVVLVFRDVTEQRRMEQKLARSEYEESIILNSMSEFVVYHDESHRITWVNRRAQQCAGLGPDSIKGRRCHEVFHGLDKPHPACPVRRALRTKQSEEAVIEFPDGSIWSVRAYPVVHDGLLEGVVEVAQDITRQRRTERELQRQLELAEKREDALRLNEQRLEALLELSHLRGAADEQITRFALEHGVSLTRSEVGYLVFLKDGEIDPNRVHWSAGTASEGAATKRAYGWLLEAKLWADCVRFGRPVIDNDGHWIVATTGADGNQRDLRRHMSVPVLDGERVVVVAGVVNKKEPYDESDARQLSILMNGMWELLRSHDIEERISYLSFHDSLTGLYNRAYFEEELRRLDTPRQLPLSIVIGDLNGLKIVNDALGHQAGDDMLRKMAWVLKRVTRHEDIIARWGGDEFIVLLPRTSMEGALALCQRVKKACAALENDPVPLSISLGVATKNSPEQDMGKVLKEAEDWMYKHKVADERSERNSIIATLVKTLEERDQRTEEHSLRMQKMALKFGRRVGLSDVELDQLALLATLHDIGKIAIPDAILRKPERLTAREWEVMRRHPEIGYRIAQASPDLAHVANAILAHQEWWDGSGYPRGLKGKEIPIVCRILAIVDAYDAMTNDRPYRRAMSEEEVLDELRRCAGTQFDPELVAAFIEMLAASSAAVDSVGT